MRLSVELRSDLHQYRADGIRRFWVVGHCLSPLRFKNDAYQTSARLANRRPMLRIQWTLRSRMSSSVYPRYPHRAPRSHGRRGLPI